jgi:hypothetical protein
MSLRFRLRLLSLQWLVGIAAGSGRIHRDYQTKRANNAPGHEQSWSWSPIYVTTGCSASPLADTQGRGTGSRQMLAKPIYFKTCKSQERWETGGSLSTSLLGSIRVCSHKPLSRWSDLAALSFEAA